MSIIYTLISRASEKILCEYTEYRGNFEQIARLLLKKTARCDKASISYDDKYLFHYTTENKITYMAMCDSTYPVETAFEFIEVIKQLFMKTFSQDEINMAYAYSLNQKFKDPLKQKMDYFNVNCTSTSTNQIELLKSNISQTTNILIDSTQVLGDRSEKINLIVKKAELLRSDSVTFFDNAIKVKDRSKRKRVRLFILITLLLLIASYMIAAMFCGWTFGCLKDEVKEPKQVN